MKRLFVTFSEVEPTDPLTHQHDVTHEKVVRNLFMGRLVASLFDPPDYWIYNMISLYFFADFTCIL